MEVTNFGIRAKSSLPVTIDSLRVANCGGKYEELRGGMFYLAKPKGAYGPLWKRAYHAWLVLTNRAMAVQHMRDHLTMAGKLEPTYQLTRNKEEKPA